MCCSMNIRGRSIRHQPWWSAWKMDAVRRRTKWRSRRCLNLFWKTTICAEKVGHLNLTPFQGTKNSGLVNEWTYNGNPATDVEDNEWEVSATGSYCVTVPDDGCPNSFDESDCAFIDIVSAIDIDVFLGGSITDCDGGGIEPGEDATVTVNPAFAAEYADYTITWPDGTVTTVDDDFTWVLLEETDINGTQICVNIEDPYGCEPQEACGLVFIGDDPTWDPLPIYNGVRALYPGQPETFDLNANFNGRNTATILGQFNVPTRWWNSHSKMWLTSQVRCSRRAAGATI